MTQVTITSPNAEAVAEHLRRMYPNYIKPAQAAVIQAVAIDTVKEMQEPGVKPSGPINWDSEKQRRYVMMLLSETKNIPYQRTGDYVAGWQYAISEMKARIFNNRPETKFIGGNPFGVVSSGIHVMRWRNFGVIVAAMLARIPALQRQALANAVQAFLSERG